MAVCVKVAAGEPFGTVEADGELVRVLFPGDTAYTRGFLLTQGQANGLAHDLLHAAKAACETKSQRSDQ